MKAVRLYKYGEAAELVLEDAPDPVAKEGEAVLAVAAAGLNPVDIAYRRGYMHSFAPLSFPAILGIDVAGTVLSVGPGVTSLRRGDRVVGQAVSGAYAERAIVKADAAAKIPDGLDFAAAAILPVVGFTGRRAVMAVGAKPGLRILVTGALGAVGRVAVHAARKAGATVISGIRANRVAAANALGVSTVVIDDAAAMERLGKVDAVIETVGGAVASEAPRWIKDGGTLALVASRAPAQPNKRISMVQVSGTPDPAMLRELLADAARGELVLPIAKRMRLSEASAAHHALEAGGVGGKIVLTP